MCCSRVAAFFVSVISFCGSRNCSCFTAIFPFCQRFFFSLRVCFVWGFFTGRLIYQSVGLFYIVWSICGPHARMGSISIKGCGRIQHSARCTAFNRRAGLICFGLPWIDWVKKKKFIRNYLHNHENKQKFCVSSCLFHMSWSQLAMALRSLLLVLVLLLNKSYPRN